MALTLNTLASIVVSTRMLHGSLRIWTFTLWNLIVCKDLMIFFCSSSYLQGEKKQNKIQHSVSQPFLCNIKIKSLFFVLWILQVTMNGLFCEQCVCHVCVSLHCAPYECDFRLLTGVLFPWRDQPLFCIGLNHRSDWVRHLLLFIQFPQTLRNLCVSQNSCRSLISFLSNFSCLNT